MIALRPFKRLSQYSGTLNAPGSRHPSPMIATSSPAPEDVNEDSTVEEGRATGVDATVEAAVYALSSPTIVLWRRAKSTAWRAPGPTGQATRAKSPSTNQFCAISQ